MDRGSCNVVMKSIEGDEGITSKYGRKWNSCRFGWIFFIHPKEKVCDTIPKFVALQEFHPLKCVCFCQIFPWDFEVHLLLPVPGIPKLTIRMTTRKVAFFFTT